MVAIPGVPKACIDAFEGALLLPGSASGAPAGSIVEWSPYVSPGNLPVIAISERGRIPQAHISGVQAREACRRAGKRLCSSDEWLGTCRGRERRTFPYGETYLAGACNEGRPTHPILDFFGQPEETPWLWTLEAMNHPGINQQAGTLDPTGTRESCRTPDGVYDLVGNLHEWVEEPASKRGIFRGGFYVDAKINGEGCSYRTTAHPMTYHDYSTGFRCCADAD